MVRSLIAARAGGGNPVRHRLRQGIRHDISYPLGCVYVCTGRCAEMLLYSVIKEIPPLTIAVC